MEQRLLRLGDIVDDYCPRERRVTNHAIVAIVENTVRQTRCSTCDAEHEYKEGKVPKKRTKTGADGTDLAGGVLVTPKAATNGTASPNTEPAEVREPEVAVPAAATANGAESPEAPADAAEESQPDEPGPVLFTHRPLIRASLPKTDGEPPPPRAIPEFTMHQRQGRGFGGGGRGGFRHGGYQGGGGQSFRGGGYGHSNGSNGANGNGNEPDGNRGPQAGRPSGGPGGPGGGPGGGGGGRRRRRRRR